MEFSELEDAQAECATISHCGGITREAVVYTLRKGPVPEVRSSSSSGSYVKSAKGCVQRKAYIVSII